jgi:DNA modification methylase
MPKARTPKSRKSTTSAASSPRSSSSSSGAVPPTPPPTRSSSTARRRSPPRSPTSTSPPPSPQTGVTLLQGDCLELLPALPDGSVNLIAIDPPYNIAWSGYGDHYDDNKASQDYLAWVTRWLAQADVKLHKHGSMWIAINDEYVSEIDVRAKALGLHKRGHIIWHYTFGVACQNKFSRTHTHWLYYTKTKSKFTFNATPVRVPSSRILKYQDPRAAAAGCLPADVWVLHPDELEKCFQPDQDTWLESRICGTFKERAQRGTYQEQRTCPQMPLPVMDRIICSCSNPGDLVVDFFLGNGSTAASALRHGRKFWGCDLSEHCVAVSRSRCEQVSRELS